MRQRATGSLPSKCLRHGPTADVVPGQVERLVAEVERHVPVEVDVELDATIGHQPPPSLLRDHVLGRWPEILAIEAG